MSSNFRPLCHRSGGHTLMVAVFAFALTSNAFGQPPSPGGETGSTDQVLARFSDPTSGVVGVSIDLIDPNDGGIVGAVLERVEVFADDAVVIVNDGASEQKLAPEGATYFRGRLIDNPDSLVTLTVEDNGNVYGVINDGERVWEIGPTGSVPALQAVPVDTTEIPDFKCEGGLEVPKEALVDGAQLEVESSSIAELAAGQYFQATIAIDTDHAFYATFGSTSGATSYIGSLFNYISGIYEDETDTKLNVGNVYLYSTSSDPWSGTSTYDRLMEFRSYWLSNRGSVTRTLAHFLSSESLGGGIAWLDVLCNNSFGYGVSANLAGFYTSAGGIAWDGVVAAHEIGHNFSSPHTHCYRNVGGNTNPVDACYNGETGGNCWTGSTSLPGSGSLIGGTSGQRHGTIMSYCHQLSGGITNIAPTFGKNTNRGVVASRVSNLMKARAAAVATANPSCMPIVGAPGNASSPGLYNPAAGAFYLRNSNSAGVADESFGFGPTGRGWRALSGDWNSNGQSTAGLYDPGTGRFYLRNSHGGGPADVSFGFGPRGLDWRALSGDWDGNGSDTVGLYDPATGGFFLRNSLSGGAAHHSFRFGPTGRNWWPMAGDWNGDGVSTVGLYDPATGAFYLRNSHGGGAADASFRFGPAGRAWVPLPGDWNGDRSSTIGLYDPSTGSFHLRNSLSGGPADLSFRFGPAPSSWIPLSGRWTR